MAKTKTLVEKYRNYSGVEIGVRRQESEVRSKRIKRQESILYGFILTTES
jgi:hypothetical protein